MKFYYKRIGAQNPSVEYIDAVDELDFYKWLNDQNTKNIKARNGVIYIQVANTNELEHTHDGCRRLAKIRIKKIKSQNWVDIEQVLENLLYQLYLDKEEKFKYDLEYFQTYYKELFTESV